MVATNGKTNKKKGKAVEPEPEFDFNIDPELIEPGYNQIRRPQLPYGIVVNDNPAGIIIPVDQLEKAGWLRMPDEEELTTVEYTEDVTGLLLKSARMLVLGFVPEYIRYKPDVEDLGGTIVGSYEECKSRLDKKIMEVCCEHALVFLDENNRPLHSIAIVVRFKNVALWSFKAAREDYYRALERAFADYCQINYSGKNDKWRSLGVLECQFKAQKEGEGNNRHYCMKTISITKPTANTFPQLFLGTPKIKEKIWGLHDEIAGFSESTNAIPALPSALDPEIEVLPPSKRKETKSSNSSNSSKRRQQKRIEAITDEEETGTDAEEEVTEDPEDLEESDELEDVEDLEDLEDLEDSDEDLESSDEFDENETGF